MLSLRTPTTLLLSVLLLTTACHKTFVRDEGSTDTVSPKVEAKQVPADDSVLNKEKSAANTLMVECIYETSSNVKLQILLDTKKKTVIGASSFDLSKNETAAAKFQKATKQTTEDKTQTVDFADGMTLTMTTSLYKKGQEADVLINDEDAYHCN
jgi:hypothetical protein